MKYLKKFSKLESKEDSKNKCTCIESIKFEKKNMNFFKNFEYGFTENIPSNSISVSYDDGRFVTIPNEIFNKHFNIKI